MNYTQAIEHLTPNTEIYREERWQPLMRVYKVNNIVMMETPEWNIREYEPSYYDSIQNDWTVHKEENTPQKNDTTIFTNNIYHA